MESPFRFQVSDALLCLVNIPTNVENVVNLYITLWYKWVISVFILYSLKEIEDKKMEEEKKIIVISEK